MPDETKNGLKKTETADKPTTTRKIGLSGLHARVMASQSQAPIEAQLPNRIELLLDCSGSMGYESLGLLKQAVVSFCNSTNWYDTAVGFVTFPPGARMPLSSISALITVRAQSLEADGGTPMGGAMQTALSEDSITRAVLITDGDATDGNLSIDMAHQYAEAGVPIDCIHIGPSIEGEERLRQIAAITGGIYLKFKDATKLVGALKYLTPALRGLLTQGVAKQLGADEVKG